MQCSQMRTKRGWWNPSHLDVIKMCARVFRQLKHLASNFVPKENSQHESVPANIWGFSSCRLFIGKTQASRQWAKIGYLCTQAHTPPLSPSNTHTYTKSSTQAVCMSVCVCECEWVRDGERERKALPHTCTFSIHSPRCRQTSPCLLTWNSINAPLRTSGTLLFIHQCRTTWMLCQHECTTLHLRGLYTRLRAKTQKDRDRK